MMRALAIATILCLCCWAAGAFAQSGSANNCSQTVGATAAAVAFPASGSTGPSRPSVYFEMCNASAANTLGLNWVGGTAAIGAVGTLTLSPGGCKWLVTPEPVPVSVSVIGSAGGTVTACAYQ